MTTGSLDRLPALVSPLWLRLPCDPIRKTLPDRDGSRSQPNLYQGRRNGMSLLVLPPDSRNGPLTTEQTHRRSARCHFLDRRGGNEGGLVLARVVEAMTQAAGHIAVTASAQARTILSCFSQTDSNAHEASCVADSLCARQPVYNEGAFKSHRRKSPWNSSVAFAMASTSESYL